MKRNILLTPGPTPVPEAVREVLAQPIIHHRTPQYRKIFESVTARLSRVFRTARPVYTMAGSGTLAMETALVNFHAAGDSTLVIEAGKFGERFTHIAQAYGLKPVILKVPYGEAVRPADVKEMLAKHPEIRSVCVELCETSTAVTHDIKTLGEMLRNTDKLLIVDAVSGIAADELETDAWGVDLVAAGSQKALMLPPGLAFLSVSEKAEKQISRSNLPRFYTDIRLYKKGLADWDSPFTPPVGLVIALEKSLEMIEAEGIENVWARCRRLGGYTREKLSSLGMELFSKAPSNTLSAAWVPEGIDGERLVKIMRDEKGVTLAGGQGKELKGKIIRICHMGAITQPDLDEGFRVLQETLQEMKVASR